MAKRLQCTESNCHTCRKIQAHFQLWPAASPITSRGLPPSLWIWGGLWFACLGKDHGRRIAPNAGPRSPDIACFYLLLGNIAWAPWEHSCCLTRLRLCRPQNRATQLTKTRTTWPSAQPANSQNPKAIKCSLKLWSVRRWMINGLSFLL